MAGNPRLLRRRGGRGFLRRSVFVGALAGMLLVAPGASGLPAVVDVVPSITGTLGANGWYRGDVRVAWDKSGETDSAGCDTVTLRADTPGTKITCKAWNDTPPGPPIEDEVSKSVTIFLDKTAPAVASVAERPADANGWYNRPLAVSFPGTDATSGISNCTSGQYAGPDTATAIIAGSCTDKAGNQAAASFAFKYDATPPSVFGVAATHGNRSAQVSWRRSSDTQVVEVYRAPGRNGQGESGIYRGSGTGVKDTGLVVGRKYEYRVVGIDQAASRAER